MDWSDVAEIGGTPTTRASAGYAGRAAELQELIRDANTYLEGGLGTSFAPVVLVLDETDWATPGDEAPPYGIPYAADDGVELVLPADHAHNPLVDLYATVGSREGAERFADLIAVHELGHHHTRALGLALPDGWLSELVATYLGCSYLTAHRPDDAALFFGLARAHAVKPSPGHRSLEVLDELYIGVGAENYIWYQDVLTAMVEQVLPERGLGFVRDLRSAGLTPASDTSQTLAAAERLHPGFEAWAGALRD